MTFKTSIEADGANIYVAAVKDATLNDHSIAISVDDGEDIYMSPATASILIAALMAAVSITEGDDD